MKNFFLNVFPFENSYYLFYFWIGLDVVRSTGNLSSTANNGWTCHVNYHVTTGLI